MDGNMDIEASDISSFKTAVTPQVVGGETSLSFSKNSDVEDMSDNAEDGSKCRETDANKSAVPDEKMNSSEDVDEVQEIRSDQSPEVLLTEQQETALLKNLDEIGNVEKVGPVLTEQQESALLKNFDETGDVEKVDPVLTQQQKVTLLKNLDEIGNVEKLGPVICLLDKEEADNQKNNVQQHAEKEANDDLQILCIKKSPETNELIKQNDVVKEAETKPQASDVTAPAVDISQTSTHSVVLNEGSENNNFEEISEGSIDPMEQDVLEGDELFSDVEIIGEYFVPTKDQNNKNNADVHKNKPQDSKDKYKNSKPTEGKVITPGTNKVNIMADNDEISDTSMSDHADDNLSLEEISDDDLEPSKRKRKSSGSVTVMAKNDPLNNKTTTFNKNEKSQKLDKTNANKRSVSEVGDGSSGSLRKRRKSSNEMSTNEELPPENEKMRLFTTKTHADSRNEEKRQPTKNQDGSSTRNPVPSTSRKLSQSSKSWKQEDTDKTQSPGDLSAFRRKLMVDSSCQSEPQLLKGKIVQCNINPMKAKPESETKQGRANDDSTASDLLEKLKHWLPSVPEGLISEVISPQPSHNGAYSLRMGPLKVSHMNSSEFINAVLGATDNFSFVFDNYCQGVFKATFTKSDSLQSLMRWLTNKEWDTEFMVISINTCEKESQTSICKATLLVNKHDKQKDSQKEMNNETKLVLTGVSESVNLEFVHLLFSQAQKIAAGFNRTTSLEFSSNEVLEDILSTYRLLDINGCNISMSQHNLQDTDTVDELETATKEGTAFGGQSTLLDKEEPVHSEPCSNVQPADEDQTQSGSGVVMDDIRDKLKSSQPATKGEMSAVPAAQDSDGGTPSKAESPSVLPAEADAILKNNSLSQKHTDIKVNIANESNSLNEQGNQEEMKGTDSENADKASSLEQAETEDKSLNLVLSEEGIKLEADEQTKSESEAELSIRKDISAHECKLEVPVSSVENKYVDDDDDKETASNPVTEAAVTAVADTDAGDGKFEDVSDDDMVNHNKPDDGGEQTLKMSADDISSENVLSKVRMKDSATEDFLQEDGQRSSNKQAEASSSEGKHLDSRLVMTDGDLEITMEVIDIDDSVEIGRVMYPSRSVQALRDNRTSTYSSPRGPYEQYYTSEYLPGSQYSRPSHIRESAVQRSDSFTGKDRTSSDNWNRGYDGRQQHGTDPHFRDTSESQGRLRESPYHSRYVTKKSHRDLHRRRSRSRSLSIVSVSLEDQEGTVRRSSYRRSNEDPVRTSRSPISISSKSCSLSPVSRSPSLELPKSELENKELVKTVQHFMKLAKGIQLKEKRGRRRMSSRHSRSPVSHRSRSPQKSSSSRFLYSRSQHAKRSRSPERSKSPALISSLKHRDERSLSPVSSINDSKRSRTDQSFSGKRGGPYSKGRDSSPSYKKSRTYRSGEYSHNIKSKPGPWPAQNYRSNDQPWQPPYMAYQTSQNSGPPHVNNIYNPAYPPPQVPAGVYPGSSAPPPVYTPNYSSIPPPSIPPSYNIPPPSTPNSISQPYQSPFQMYTPRF